jgi:diaminopimelate decarboxylase
VRSTRGIDGTWDVVGPVCESGDWLGRDRSLAVAEGDLRRRAVGRRLCMSMASNYNTRPRAAEVMVHLRHHRPGSGEAKPG